MGISTSDMSAADIAAVTGNNGGFGNGGDGAWWIIILFLFALMGNNWGNGNGTGGYGYGVQQGFDQAAVMSGINGLTAAVTNGFGNAEVSRCNAQANILQTLNNNQNANTNALNALGLAIGNGFASQQLQTCQLGNQIATEACADRSAINDALRDVIENNNNGVQRILDTMYQDKLDAKNERIQELQQQLTMANLSASQNQQTAQIMADNAAQTFALEQYLNPTPVPAYVVPNPNCCGNNFNNGCGCNTSF